MCDSSSVWASRHRTRSQEALSIHSGDERVMKMDQSTLIIHVPVQNITTFNEIDKQNHCSTIKKTYFTLVLLKIIIESIRSK